MRIKNINTNLSLIFMMKKEMVRRALESFKGLSGKQADALIAIVKQQKKLTKKEIVVLLDKKNISRKQTGYRLIDELIARKVLFPDNDYLQPINTRMLVDDCSKGLTLMESEIEGLEITAEWNKTDPFSRSKKLKHEHEIIHEIYGIQTQNCDVFYYCTDEDKDMEFWKNLKERFNGIKIEDSTHNSIVFTNKDNKPFESGALILSKRLNKQGATHFYGNLIFDEALCTLFGKRGEKNE
jgi:hypothetical protein